MSATGYENPELVFSVWFSDEIYVHLNGFIDKQTGCPDNGGRELANVPCATSAKSILGRSFVRDDHGNVTRYVTERKIIRPLLRDLTKFCYVTDLGLCSQLFYKVTWHSHVLAFPPETFVERRTLRRDVLDECNNSISPICLIISEKATNYRVKRNVWCIENILV